VDLLSRIRRDHRELLTTLGLLDELSEGSPKMRTYLLRRLRRLFEDHCNAEERALYAAMAGLERQSGRDASPRKGEEEHHAAGSLLRALCNLPPDHPDWYAKLLVLNEAIRDHLEEEERTVLPAAARQFSGSALLAMGEWYEAARTGHFVEHSGDRGIYSSHRGDSP
jgi:hemerythrin-like domain-containing protein